MEIQITKQYTLAKAKADIKTQVVSDFINFLSEKYGEDAVRLLRTGGQSKTNEIGFICGIGIGEDGEKNPIVVTLNPTVKEFTNHKSEKKNYIPFDFYGAAFAYDTYVIEKAQKDADASAAREVKRKRDEAARAKAREAMEAKS